MPVPVPATDDQLRHAADRTATRWIDDNLRTLRQKWDDPQTSEQALAAIPAGPRRDWWSRSLRRYADDRTRRVEAAVAPRRREAADQAYAALLATTPRPTDQDLVRPTPETAPVLAGVAAATEVGQALTALAAGAEADIAAFVARAAALEKLRATKLSELKKVCGALTIRVGRADRVEADAGGLDSAAVLLALLTPLFDARDRAREASVPDTGAEAADRELRVALDRTPDDEQQQQQALAAAFDAAVAHAKAAEAALAAQFDVLGEKLLKHLQRFPSGSSRTYQFEEFARFYGYAGAQALYALDTRILAAAFVRLTGHHNTLQETMRRRWPKGTSSAQLARTLRLIAQPPDSPNQLEDVLRHLDDDPKAPLWPHPDAKLQPMFET